MTGTAGYIADPDDDVDDLLSSMRLMRKPSGDEGENLGGKLEHGLALNSIFWTGRNDTKNPASPTT